MQARVMMQAARPLFVFLNGDRYFTWMWRDGPVQPEWVAEAFDVIAAPAANVAGGPLAPAEFQSRLQRQKLLVRLSNAINEVTAEYPSLFTPENVQDALATITAWVRHQS